VIKKLDDFKSSYLEMETKFKDMEV